MKRTWNESSSLHFDLEFRVGLQSTAFGQNETGCMYMQEVVFVDSRQCISISNHRKNWRKLRCKGWLFIEIYDVR